MRQESSLHKSLKNWYAEQGDGELEVPVDGFLVDVVLGDLLVEIQTRHFHAIRLKLAELLVEHRVRLVYPIAQEKWIINLPAQGESRISRRKSPRHGRVEHVFQELVRLPRLITHPNFSIEVVLTHEEEIRRDDGKGSWRRQGVSIVDRRLLEVVDWQLLATPEDFKALLPPALSQPFTNRELEDELKLPPGLAGRMTYCLREMGVLTIAGKRARASLFRVI